jgi:hypothetical protein
LSRRSKKVQAKQEKAPAMLAIPAPSTPPSSPKDVGSGVAVRSYRFADECAAKLADPVSRAKALRDTYLNDPRVSQGVDDAVDFAVNGAWEVVPGGDRPIDRKAAALVGAILLQADNRWYKSRDLWTRPRWPNLLRTMAFACAVHGHAAFFETWRRAGNFLVPDLQYLEPASITQWVLRSDDSIEKLVRDYVRADGESVTREGLDGSALTIVNFRAAGADYKGISLVRTAYAASVRKQALQTAKMVAAKRKCAAIPVLKTDAAVVPGTEEWARLEAFLQSMLDPDVDQAYLMGSIIPSYLEAGSMQGLEVIDRWIASENTEIAAAGGVKSQLLGETASGSRALGTAISSREKVGLAAFANSIAGGLNFGVGGLEGLVEKIARLNCPPNAATPWLKFVPAKDADELAGVSVFVEAVKAGAVTPTPEAQLWIYRSVGLEETTADELDRQPQEGAQQPLEGAADAGRNNPPDPSAEAPTEAPTAPETASA